MSELFHFSPDEISWIRARSTSTSRSKNFRAFTIFCYPMFLFQDMHIAIVQSTGLGMLVMRRDPAGLTILSVSRTETVYVS